MRWLCRYTVTSNNVKELKASSGNDLYLNIFVSNVVTP